MRKIFWIGALIFIFFAAFFVFQRENGKLRYSPAGNVLQNIKIGGQTFQVEAVFSAEKITLGLSDRDSMCEYCGMFFIFGRAGQRSFWMKDMKFDLDMLWIEGDKIVYLAKNVSHEKGSGEIVSPEIKADKVLELNAGTSERLGIKIGDSIEF